MNKSSTMRTPSFELVNQYELLSTARGNYLDSGDSKAANRAFDEETAIRHELRKRGDLKMLLRLLESPDPWVRLDVAAPALFFSPDEAEPVLEHLTHQGRALGITARMTLEIWRRGELKDF